MFKKYILRFLIFASLIAIILIVLGLFQQFKNVMSFAWVCYTLFFILSIVTFYFSSKTIHGRFSNFMNIYFAGIIGKLIITAIVVMIFKSDNETSSINYLIPFAIIYFSFLVFETAELVKLSNQNKTK